MVVKVPTSNRRGVKKGMDGGEGSPLLISADLQYAHIMTTGAVADAFIS